MVDEKDSKVSCYRKVLRSVRTKISWNERPLGFQIRIQFIILLTVFFIIQSAILIGLTLFVYPNSFNNTTKNQQQRNLLQRLDVLTKSYSTSIYHFDRDAILQSQRIRDAYQNITVLPALLENQFYDTNSKLGASCVGSGILNLPAVRSLSYFFSQLTIQKTDTFPAPRHFFILFDNQYCVYPPMNLTNDFSYMKSGAYSSIKNKSYVIERNQTDLLNKNSSTTFTSYYAPVQKDGKVLGAVMIQYEQVNLYSSLAPSTIFNQPYAASLVSLYDLNLKPIYVNSSLSSQLQNQIHQYIASEGKQATQNKTQVHFKIQGIDVSLIRGPSANLSLHNQYDAANDVYTLVGQSQSLTQKMKEHVYTIIWDDMSYFHVGIFLLNLVLYSVVTVVQERLLNKKLIKPIVELTKNIKNPQERLRKESIAQGSQTKFFERTDTNSNLNERRFSEDFEQQLQRDRLDSSFDSTKSSRVSLYQKQGSIKFNEFKAQKGRVSGPVNEVQALTDVFYAFFLTRSRNVGEGHEVVMMAEMDKSRNTFFVQDLNLDQQKAVHHQHLGLLTIQEQLSNSSSTSINKESKVNFISLDEGIDTSQTKHQLDRKNFDTNLSKVAHYIDNYEPSLPIDWLKKK